MFFFTNRKPLGVYKTKYNVIKVKKLIIEGDMAFFRLVHSRVFLLYQLCFHYTNYACTTPTLFILHQFYWNYTNFLPNMFVLLKVCLHCNAEFVEICWMSFIPSQCDKTFENILLKGFVELTSRFRDFCAINGEIGKAFYLFNCSVEA